MEELFKRRIENFNNLMKLEKNVSIASMIILNALKSGNKILFCGNGGSAADSNHLSAEFVSRFKKNRKSLPAISLAANTSILTAIGNDFSFDDVFKRQIEGLGNKNDVLFAITTSGKSKNIIKAVGFAKINDIKTILLTGINKTNLNCDLEINVPSDITAEIQEMHIALGHIICELVENEF